MNLAQETIPKRIQVERQDEGLTTSEIKLPVEEGMEGVGTHYQNYYPHSYRNYYPSYNYGSYVRQSSWSPSSKDPPLPKGLYWRELKGYYLTQQGTLERLNG